MVQHIGPNLDYEVKAEHPSRGWIDNCGPVYGKMRSGIVARIYHGWVTLVMLYTSNGNGMERKPPNVREDAIPVVYHADKRRLELRAARKPYLATLCKMVKTNHHAYMTRPVNVILDTPIAIVGSLTSASVNRVLHYYQAYSDKGTLSLAGQIRWTLPVPVLEAISPPLGATEDHKGFTEVLSDSTRRILDSRKASTDRSNQRQAELRKSPLFGGFSSLPEEGDNGEEGDEEEDEEYESEVEREP